MLMSNWDNGLINFNILYNFATRAKFWKLFRSGIHKFVKNCGTEQTFWLWIKCDSDGLLKCGRIYQYIDLEVSRGKSITSNIAPCWHLVFFLTFWLHWYFNNYCQLAIIIFNWKIPTYMPISYGGRYISTSGIGQYRIVTFQSSTLFHPGIIII